MKTVKIIFESDCPIRIETKSGELSKKGYFHPKDGEKIFALIKNTILRPSAFNNDLMKKEWSIISFGTIALDVNNNSIACYIPENDYYIPAHTNNGQVVFKVRYPNLVCIKERNNVYYFWTSEKYESFTINTKIYPLESPHINSIGLICKGSFKGDLDFANPKKYFIDLLSFPVSHNWEIEKLRKSEKGYKKNYNSETTVAKLLNL